MPARPQLPDFDPFIELGVTPDDPPEAVKAAWRARVKEHHPDASGGSDERIKRINVAYEWLRDPSLRQALLAARAARAQATWGGPAGPPPRWGIDLRFDQDGPGQGFEEEPPADAIYTGPRAAAIEALADRIGRADMPDLVDLVHGDRPDLRWTLWLAAALDEAGRSADGAVAVWQVRRRLRERLEELLRDPRVHRDYDEEFVGQVVADRLADLVRAIVLLDLLSPEARERVALEWEAVMGLDAPPPGDEVALADPDPVRAAVRTRWGRVSDSGRLMLTILAAAAWAVFAVMVFPSREAFAVILIGFGIAAALASSRRRPG
ncbi:MAG: J domain-containing protein [Chloroflexota bacterium]